MNRSVFINASSSFFPNAPVDNENVERILGTFKGKLSKSRAIVLASNQIKQRYYAIDPVTRAMSHTNADITAGAVRGLFEGTTQKMSDMQLLACGSSTPDMLMPAHGQMVQGLLPDFSGEVVTTSGVLLQFDERFEDGLSECPSWRFNGCSRGRF